MCHRLHSLGKTGPHGTDENRGSCPWPYSTLEEEILEQGYLTHILALSVAPCFFSLKHFSCSQATLDDLEPNFNLRQPLPFHLLSLGPPPHTPALHPQRQLVWALQMQTHLNVSWSNTQLEGKQVTKIDVTITAS